MERNYHPIIIDDVYQRNDIVRCPSRDPACFPPNLLFRTERIGPVSSME